MKAIFAILFLAAIAVGDNVYNEFVQWTMENGKVYNSAEDHVKRFENYRKNKELVAALNSQGGAYFELNKFADMSQEEFAATYLHPVPVYAKGTFVPATGVNEDFDWREKGAVNGVKDQASCGSCWAFSVVANMETAYYLKYNVLPSLSEQQLVDCDHGCMITTSGIACDQGCDGGWMPVAMKYGIKNGMMTEAEYPYQAVAGTCAYDASKATYKFTEYKAIGQTEADLMEAVKTYGPLSIGVDATYWSFYKSGLYTSICSTTTMNHGVALVGYADNYWIIRNSWGTSWGESGYIRVPRADNKCGVCNFANTIIA